MFDQYCESFLSYADDDGMVTEQIAHKIVKDHGLYDEFINEWEQSDLYDGEEILHWLGY